jgi:signal transduction histidine kinase
MREEVERLLRSCENDEELVQGLLALLADVARQDHGALRALANHLGQATTQSFTHGCLHDIQNMLVTARCGLDFVAPQIRDLLEGIKTRDPKRMHEVDDILEAFDDMDEAIARVFTVVEDARALRGAVAGKADDAQARIAELVASATRMVARQHRDVSLRVERMPEVAVRAPRVAVFRVLLNLLENACQAVAGREWREVRVRGWTSQSDAFVEVADTGPGIPESDQERVFYPSVTTKPKGSGLGLFVSRALVSGWGGQLQLASQQGEGARFTFSAPLEESP